LFKKDYKFITALPEGLRSKTINHDSAYCFANSSKSYVSCLVRVIVIDMFEIIEIAENYDLKGAFTCTCKSLVLAKSKSAAEPGCLIYESLALNHSRKFFKSIYFFGKAHLTGAFQLTQNFGQFIAD